jgi:glucose/arabinose dehydrogenase
MLNASCFDFRGPLRHALSLCLACAALAAQAAPPRAVEAFDSNTWPALQAGLKQPAAVVFTTTDCMHCPAVIQGLAHTLQQRHLPARLLVVVMDQAPGEDDAALLADTHYRAADRLLAFDGQPALLRFGVDPRWRGVTPYVNLLTPKAAARAITGPPAEADIDAWVRGFSIAFTSR